MASTHSTIIRSSSSSAAPTAALPLIALALLASACIAASCSGGPSGTPAVNHPACTEDTTPCGNGCIPLSGVCCASDDTTSSYCTNAAGGGCSPNTGRQCTAAFPAPGPLAQFCCAENGDFGSNDCPAGQHHCGLLCRPLETPCATDGADAGSVGPGTCALSGKHCEPDASCCNGLTTVRDATSGTCSCYYLDGQTCSAGANVSPYRSQECCNPPSGGVAGIGVVRAACGYTSSGTCTQDSDCYIGTACVTFGAEQICQGVCGGSGWTPSTEVPCCAGFVIATSDNIAGMCALASGQLCNFNQECASLSCDPGPTTATCSD